MLKTIAKGASQKDVCEIVEITPNTFRSWLKNRNIPDKRTTTDKTNPKNKLTEKEEMKILDIMFSEEYADKSPIKIETMLLDKGEYICSASTMHRILRKHGANRKRTQVCKESKPSIKPNIVATAPNQVLVWDITFLKHISGRTFYKALTVQDMYSRKIIGMHIMKRDTLKACTDYVVNLIDKKELDTVKVLHGDNGSSLKGDLLTEELKKRGIDKSHSRPRVSNDNPYIESFFGTLKTSYKYPKNGFRNIEQTKEFMEQFIEYYNNEMHSSINYVSPNQRHNLEEEKILEKRIRVLANHFNKYPERFPNGLRKIKIEKAVCLNPMSDLEIKEHLIINELIEERLYEKIEIIKEIAPNAV